MRYFTGLLNFISLNGILLKAFVFISGLNLLGFYFVLWIMGNVKRRVVHVNEMKTTG